MTTSPSSRSTAGSWSHDAIDPADLAQLEERCDEIIERSATAGVRLGVGGRHRSGTSASSTSSSRAPRSSGPSSTTRGSACGPIEFASALMRRPLEFWYDQFLGKPPRQRACPRYWHQDEGYWGRNLDDKGITCWMPLHDVDERNGCMHFIDGGHKRRRARAQQPDDVQSDLLVLRARRDAATVACPIARRRRHVPPQQDAAHDHGRTRPTRGGGSSPSTSGSRAPPARATTIPWKVYVNQFTGERTMPDTR